MNNKIHQKNLEIINKYKKFRIDEEDDKISTVNEQTTTLIKFSRHLNKPINNPKKEDIISFLSQVSHSTQIIYLSKLKKFYRWLYKLDENDKLPDFIHTIKRKNHKTKEDSELEHDERRITTEEYELLLKSTIKPQEKALIETLWTFGTRKSELTSMNTNDYFEKEKIRQVRIRKSKTKIRTITTDSNTPWLSEWINTYHPYKDQKEKPMWISFSNRNLNGRMKPGTINSIIDKIRIKAEIKRKISPHDFRHTAISRDRDLGLPTTHIESKYGLVKSSLMLQVYDHNGTKDLENYYNKTSQIKEIPRTELERKHKEVVENHKKIIKKYEEDIKLLKTKSEAYEKYGERLTELKEQIEEMVKWRKNKILQGLSYIEYKNRTDYDTFQYINGKTIFLKWNYEFTKLKPVDKEMQKELEDNDPGLIEANKQWQKIENKYQNLSEYEYNEKFWNLVQKCRDKLKQR